MLTIAKLLTLIPGPGVLGVSSGTLHLSAAWRSTQPFFAFVALHFTCFFPPSRSLGDLPAPCGMIFLAC